MANLKQAFVSSHVWASINMNAHLAVRSLYINDQLKMDAVLSVTQKLTSLQLLEM